MTPSRLRLQGRFRRKAVRIPEWLWQTGNRLHVVGLIFPADVSYTRPEGGMFLWAGLPQGLAALDLFELAVKDKVVFVPGDPFYVRGSRQNTLRLNFSCTDADATEIVIGRLGKAIQKLMEKKAKQKDATDG